MKVGIAGAGNMGSGIAQKYATEGHEVVLFDNSEEGLIRGKSLIQKTLQEGVLRGVFTETRAQQIESRLHFTCDLNALVDADLVIEAIFEAKELKVSLFRELDARCAAKTIFATNTSSFRVRELANSTRRADRVVGLHYFYHPAKNRLVEVIRAEHTSIETFDKVYALQEAIGKIPITSADSPGFVVNRFFVPWLNEAMRIVEAGVANIPTVEWAAKKAFEIGMGPFELMNVTGVPITFHAATTLSNELGEFYKPSALIEPLVASGSKWELSGPINQDQFDAIERRLKDVVFTVAKQMVLEEKVCTIEECDLGARVGLRWKRGPFEMMAEQEPGLAPKRLTLSQEADVGIITLNRPDALNAIDFQGLKELDKAIDAFIEDPSVSMIVLKGKGRAFAAGADTQFFVDNMRSGHIQRIVDFATFGQQVLKKIDDSPKPVVAIAHGMTLGGGLELALACDHIICVNGAQLGFPETGIGIYPGLGGTQRTPRRVGVALARWLILSGEILSSQRALEIRLVDLVCDGAEALGEAIALGKRSVGLKELTSFFERPLSLLSQTKPSPVQIDIQKALKKIAHKAPIALRIADELISASGDISMEEGLKRETLKLADVFSTKDALLGVSSIGNGKPVFSGS